MKTKKIWIIMGLLLLLIGTGSFITFLVFQNMHTTNQNDQNESQSNQDQIFDQEKLKELVQKMQKDKDVTYFKEMLQQYLTLDQKARKIFIRSACQFNVKEVTHELVTAFWSFEDNDRLDLIDCLKNKKISTPDGANRIFLKYLFDEQGKLSRLEKIKLYMTLSWLEEQYHEQDFDNMMKEVFSDTKISEIFAIQILAHFSMTKKINKRPLEFSKNVFEKMLTTPSFTPSLFINSVRYLYVVDLDYLKKHFSKVLLLKDHNVIKLIVPYIRLVCPIGGFEYLRTLLKTPLELSDDLLKILLVELRRIGGKKSLQLLEELSLINGLSESNKMLVERVKQNWKEGQNGMCSW